MPSIYIRSKGTTLATDSSYFTLRSKGRKIGKIPPTMVERVIMEHGVEVTRKALDRMGALGIPVTFLGPEGDVRARLVPSMRNDPRARIGQMAVYFDTELSLELARRWVNAKISHSIRAVRAYLSNHPTKELSLLVKELRTIRRVNLPRVTDLPGLIGVEGLAARHYYAAFGKMLRPGWAVFQTRTRRPPKDPVNAVLSYTYGLLCHHIQSCAEAVGLDPCVGYLHGGEEKRPALALDLMEPFRPFLADRLALRLINLGTIGADDFHYPDGPQNALRIRPEARSNLIEGFYQWIQQCDSELDARHLSSPGGIVLREIEAFAKAATQRQLNRFHPCGYEGEPDVGDPIIE
jgi:CRISPR-associated protein Cas1